MSTGLVYLDNAATTFPKPQEVLVKTIREYARIGVSPGRGSHDLAVEADDLVTQTREKLASLFVARDPDRVVFASNATDALNLAFHGLLQQGDHVVSTRLEHNSVLRPLHHFRESGMITYDLARFDARGFVHPDEIARLLRPDTRLVVVTHASNVLGTIQPVEQIGQICAEKGVPFLVDASQSAGVIPIDMSAWNASAIAFTGHKSLYGPTGTGGLAIHPDLNVRSSRFGGTGVDSRNLVHTQSFPHRLEAGTLNLMGIIGLSAGIDFVVSKGMAAIHAQEMALLTRLRDGLSSLKGVRLYCAADLADHAAVLTVNIENMNPWDVGDILDADFNIAVRVGHHCAPLVHQDLGTIDQGAIRFSLGLFNTQEDIDHAVTAMASICH